MPHDVQGYERGKASSFQHSVFANRIKTLKSQNFFFGRDIRFLRGSWKLSTVKSNG
jgi:hypothetical protein